MSTGSPGGLTPLVSVVIPTHSRPEPLRDCLGALARAGEGVPYEVIVVDDGTPARLVARVEACVTEAGARLLRQQREGAAAARNLGASVARGELLVFLDDDCQPEPGWLEAMVRGSRADGPFLVGGPTVNGNPGNLFAEATQLLVAYMSHGGGDQGQATGFLPSCNLGVSRAFFERVGGFDPSFSSAGGEDRELCTRCLRSGFQIRFIAEATVRHFHHLTLFTYMRQHLRYGRGAVLYRRRCAGEGEPAGFAPWRWYLGLIMFPFQRRTVVRALPLTLLLGLAQVVTALGAAVGRLSLVAGYLRTPSKRKTITRPQSSGKRSTRNSEK